MDFQGVILNEFDGLSNVVYITAAGIDPVGDATSIQRSFDTRGIPATWSPVYGANCQERTRDENYIRQIREADGIFFGGGQSGRLQTCMFGGAESGTTPYLDALLAKVLVAGSSAGAMHQPDIDILITGSSVESYTAVRDGTVFSRPFGNRFIRRGLVDSHFSERGRQGRFLVFAADPRVRRTKWAMGVDENTAMRVAEDGSMVVVGQNGVVVYEDVPAVWPAANIRMHFLTRGDGITSDNRIVMAADKVPCTSTVTPVASNSIFAGTNFRRVSLQAAGYAQVLRVNNYHGNPAVEAMMDNREAQAYCYPSGAPVSFTDLFVSMGRADHYDNPEHAEEVMWLSD